MNKLNFIRHIKRVDSKTKIMQQKLLLIFLTISIGFTKNKCPEIKKSIEEKFPPVGWKIVGSCSADFNNDKIDDKAYVIQENKETVSKDLKKIGREPFYRKELIIKFGLNGGGYKTNLKTSKVFGEWNWGIQGTNPFDEIGRRKNTLKLSFSTGGTLRSSFSYYFRYQDGDWFLIGYDEVTYQVPYQDKYFKEINYLTGMKKSYEVVNGKSSQPKILNLGKSRLLKLSEIDASKDNSTGEE
jgi:hypothetical protein